MKNNRITETEWAAMSAAEQWEYVCVLSGLFESAESVVRMIPECPEHGAMCVPYAQDWVQAQLDGEPKTVTVLTTTVDMNDLILSPYAIVEDMRRKK